MNIIFCNKNVDEIPNFISKSNIYLGNKSYIKVFENKTTIFTNTISQKCLDIKKKKNYFKKENFNLLNSIFKINENINIELKEKEKEKEKIEKDCILEIKNIINSKKN